jgi:hypothetical protein
MLRFDTVNSVLTEPADQPITLQMRASEFEVFSPGGSLHIEQRR